MRVHRHFLSLELLCELGDGVEEISDEAVVSDLEDGGISVGVDGDDDLRVLHASNVLNRAGEADGEVEVGGDDLAGLADLHVVGAEAGVDNGAGGADGGLEGGSELVEKLEVLLVLEATAAGDDDGGGGELGLVGLNSLVLDPLGGTLGGNGGGVRDGGGASLGGGALERSGADGDELDGIGGLDSGDNVAGVGVADEGVLALDLSNIGDDGRVEGDGGAGDGVLRESGGGGNDVGEAAGLDGLDEESGDLLGEAIVVLRGLGGEDGGNAGDLGELGGGGLGVLAGDEGGDVANLGGGGDGGEGVGGELAGGDLSEDEGLTEHGDGATHGENGVLGGFLKYVLVFLGVKSMKADLYSFFSLLFWVVREDNGLSNKQKTYSNQQKGRIHLS